MNIPSITTLYEHSKETFKRFPLVCIAALIGSFTAISLIEKTNVSNFDQLFKTMIVLIIGMPLLFGTAMFSERNNFTGWKKWAIQAAPILILILHYISLPSDIDNNFAPFYQLIVFGVIYAVAATFAPYLIKNQNNGFWYYNKDLFVRLATTVLYSGTIFIGITIALVTIDNLLEVRVDDELYAQIWVVAAGIIGPWFFLHGVPKDFNKLEKNKGYHKGIRIFSQYVLTPLVITYFVILYLYSGKVIINDEWTEGIVGWLIIFFSITGVLTNLILYPIRKEKEHIWAKWFLKGFYLSVVPLIGILFYSVWLRLQPYGFTENRYWVLLLGLWLLGLSLYSLLAKKRSIKNMIISLAIVGVIGNIGPWSAYSVSERSQLSQLETLFTEAGMLENGKVQKATEQPKNSIEIENKLRYLVEYHGFESIQELFDTDLKTLNTVTDSEHYRDVLDFLDIDTRFDYLFGDTRTHYFYMEESNRLQQKITGYDYLIKFGVYISPTSKRIVTNDYSYKFQTDFNGTTFDISENDQPLISADLAEFATNLIHQYPNSGQTPSQQDLTFTTENDKVKITFIFESFEATNKANNQVTINSLNGIALLKIKSNDLNLNIEPESSPSVPETAINN